MTCKHDILENISGNLTCLNCGEVVQSNSQLSTEPSVSEMVRSKNISISSTSLSNKQPISTLSTKLSHEARSELSLHTLSRNIISTFALKSSYESKAFDVMQRYWQSTATNIRYGQQGNRLLVAVLFLLARRDHLAVNLTLLAATIDSDPHECGIFFEPLIKLDPTLRSFARVNDFSDRVMYLVVTELTRSFGLIILEDQLRQIQFQAQVLCSCLQAQESGASRSAESTALAAAWIVLEAFVVRDPEVSSRLKEANLLQVIETVAESSTLAMKTVKLKQSALLEYLQDKAIVLLPSTFQPPLKTRALRLLLLLDNLPEILDFIASTSS